MTLLLGAFALAASVVFPPAPPPDAEQNCFRSFVTGYVRTASGMNRYTYDGTSIFTSEAIAAAGWSIPINSLVRVPGAGTFRVADRGGGLYGYNVDIAVWSRAEAYELTGWKQVCIVGHRGGE